MILTNNITAIITFAFNNLNLFTKLFLSAELYEITDIKLIKSTRPVRIFWNRCKPFWK